MQIKRFINITLGRLFGYNLVRSDTFARLSSAHVTPEVFAQAQNDKPNFRLVPVQGLPPTTCSDLAPKLPADQVTGVFARQIIEFQEGGITKFDSNFGKAAEWGRNENFDRHGGNRHTAWDWAGTFMQPFSNEVFFGLPSSDLICALTKFFSSEDFEAFCRSSIGCLVSVANCRLVRSPPHTGEGIGPQQFHIDGCPAGVIRALVYLTDVDEYCGPFQYQTGENDIHSVLGKAGDLLVFDATRLFHRAMPPKSRERRAIDLAFMPRLAGQPFRFTVAGMNHWPADPFYFSAPTDRSEQWAADKSLALTQDPTQNGSY